MPASSEHLDREREGGWWGGGWEVGELGGSRTLHSWKKIGNEPPNLGRAKVIQEDERASESLQQPTTLPVPFISFPLILFLKNVIGWGLSVLNHHAGRWGIGAGCTIVLFLSFSRCTALEVGWISQGPDRPNRAFCNFIGMTSCTRIVQVNALKPVCESRFCARRDLSFWISSHFIHLMILS